MTILRIPVSYVEYGVRKGRRKAERIECGEWVDVHVADVSSDDAPVATRWKNEWKWDYEYPPLNAVSETRWFDGHHYKRVLRETADGHKQVDLDLLVEMITRGDGPFPGDYYTRKVVQGNANSIDEIELRSRHTNNRAAAIERVHEIARSHILIWADGKPELWSECREPCYLYNPNRYSRCVDVVGIPALERGLDGHYFRADRRDDLIDFIGTFSKVNIELPEIQILIPESIRYDDETPAFTDAARSLITHAPSQNPFPKERVIAWLNLRDLVYGLRGDPDQEYLQRLEDAMQHYLEMGQRHPDEFDMHESVITRALARWRNRPIDLEWRTDPTP